MNRNTLIFFAAAIAGGMSTAALAGYDDKSAPAKAEAKAEDKGDKKSDAGQTIADATITAKVKSKLLADRSTQGLKINVDTKGGVVTLTGNVKSDAEKDAAEQLAKSTDNVKDVHNELKVGKS